MTLTGLAPRASRALGAAAVVGAVVAAGRAGRRSGATDAEVAARLPGDELVRDPVWTSTRAITIDAAPEAVWPWIVQMGHPSIRAGWYTPHWLDRLQWGIPQHSADVVRPELQQLAAGDAVPDSPDWSAYFTAAQVDPGETLLLHSTRHLLRPVEQVSFSWLFHLAPTGDGQTRLIIRARVWAAPGWAARLVEPLIGVGDYVNAGAMLRGIKRRAERGAVS